MPNAAPRAVWTATMSFIKPIDMRGKAGLREAAKAIINRKFGKIHWSDSVTVNCQSDGEKAIVRVVEGIVEAALRGLPDPDFLQMDVREDHAIVSLTLTNVRVNY
jgi:hypothetical protein